MGHLVSAYENNFFRFFLALCSYVYILESVYYGFAIPPTPPQKKRTSLGILSGIVLNQKISFGKLDIIMVKFSENLVYISAKLFLMERFIIFSIKVNPLLFSLFPHTLYVLFLWCFKEYLFRMYSLDDCCWFIESMFDFLH